MRHSYNQSYTTVCSTHGCHWIYHSRFKKMGCQRRVGPSNKCGGSLQLLDLNVIPSTPRSICNVSPSPQPAIVPSVSFVMYSSPLDAAMEAMVSLFWPNGCTFNEGEAIYTLFNTIMTTHVATVKHVPRSCRQLLGEFLCRELKNASSNNIWGMARLFMVAKCTVHHQGEVFVISVPLLVSSVACSNDGLTMRFCLFGMQLRPIA